MRQQREDKGKQERAEISHPRAKLRRWSRGSEKRRSAEFAVARRLWFCRAAKCEERLRGRFPGRRAPVEDGAAVLQRDQAGQGGGNTPAAWKSWGGGAHLRRVPWNYRASEPRSREQEVGGLRGVDAGQEWGLARVDLQRGDGSMAAQRRSAGRGKSGADVLGFWVAAADGGRVQGRGAPDKRVARGSRRAGRAGDLRRGLRRPLPGGISAGTMGPTSGAGWSGGKE